MTAQETTSLPHRLARSAKDLAQASLSGVACELRDPRTAKQIGSSSQTTHQYDGSQSGEVSRSRPALYARENSFRNQPNASALRAVEEDFVRFQEERDYSQNAWLSSDLTAYVKIAPQSLRHREDSFGIQNEPHPSHHLTSGAIAKDATNDAINPEISQSDFRAINDSRIDSKANLAQAAAARRLEQIGAQIQRNLAIQMSHQDTSIQNHLAPTTAMDPQYETAQQTADQRSKTPQSSNTQSTNDSHHRVSQQPHHHHKTPAPSPQDEKDEQDDSQLDFHCPYYACHQNLRRLLTDSSGSSQRMCVHTGCSQQLETRKSWVEHIALPHHDLQG